MSGKKRPPTQRKAVNNESSNNDDIFSPLSVLPTETSSPVQNISNNYEQKTSNVIESPLISEKISSSKNDIFDDENLPINQSSKTSKPVQKCTFFIMH